MDHPITTRLVALLPHARLISRTYGLHRSEPLESGHHKGAQHENLFSIIGVVVVVVKKGYEFSHEYNEMKQELDKRASDSP
ncbi:hypothetical protein EGN69_04360 [Pseudomonas monteilii]|nr:hypothetical protein EGN69_04360 [Pseudomonas monteilii]